MHNVLNITHVAPLPIDYFNGEQGIRWFSAPKIGTEDGREPVKTKAMGYVYIR